MAREEGFEADEIDDMIYQKYKYNLSPSSLSSKATINTINNNTKISSTITTTTSIHNNNKIDEKKYFQLYFQHFQ